MLIVVSVALLSFALAPSDLDLYSKAKVEVDALRELPLHQFPASVAKITNPARDETKEFLRKFLPSIVKPYEIDENLYFTTPLVVDWPEESSTLEVFQSFFQNENSIGIVSHVIDAAIPKAFTEAIDRGSRKCVDFASNKEVPCRDIPLDYPLVEVQIEPKNESIKQVLENHLQVIRRVPDVGFLEFAFSRTKGTSTSTYIRRAKIGIATEMVDRDHHALRWLKQLPDSYKLLVAEHGDATIIFPSLSEVWDEVSHLAPDKAARYLSTKIKSTRRSLSAFGIGVDERVIILLGPAMVFFSSLYLVAQLRNLLRLLLSNSYPEQPFPWIGFFGDWLSILMVFLSIVALPVFSSVAVVHRAGSWSEARTIVGVITTIGLLFCSLWSMYLLKQVRDQTLILGTRNNDEKTG